MSISIDFSNQTVLVVGGTSGINRGIAEAFAKQGAKVAVASRSQDKVDDTVKALQDLGAEAMGFSADVRNIEALAEGMEKVQQAFGDFDILISGAAGNFPASVKGMSANAFKAVVDIDLLGTFNVMKSAYPHLKKPGASIINISAPQAFIAMQAQSHACAAKAGVDMVTRTLALEWGPEGIRINAVTPGPIKDTGGMERLATDESGNQDIGKAVPLGRIGEKQDIADACLFLSSPLASYISGVILPVDGAWSAAGCRGMTDAFQAFAQKSE